MFGLKLKSILICVVLLFVVVSILMLAWGMWGMSKSPPYVLDANKKATTEGVDAKTFWTNNKLYFAGPAVMQVLSLVMVGMLLYLA